MTAPWFAARGIPASNQAPEAIELKVPIGQGASTFMVTPEQALQLLEVVARALDTLGYEVVGTPDAVETHGARRRK